MSQLVCCCARFAGEQMENRMNVLERAKRGEANLAQIARGLLEGGGMLRVFDPADMVKYLEASPSALDEQPRPQPPQPPVLDLTIQGQRVACVFSESAHASAFAKSQNMLSNGVAVTTECSWIEGLRKILYGGYQGMMVDYGHHSLGFNDGQVRKLYAHVAWDRLVGSSELYLLVQGSSPHLLRHQEATQASAASDAKNAAAMQSVFAARDPSLRVSAFPFRAGLEMLSRAGVTELVMNNDLPDWHVYGQQELDWMRDGVTPGR